MAAVRLREAAVNAKRRIECRSLKPPPPKHRFMNPIAARILARPSEAAALLVLAALAGALAFQYLGGYSPCALCIIQRLAMCGVAALLLVARFGLAGRWRAGAAGLAALAGLLALGATGVALYQGYINLVPGLSCSARLMLTINDLPTAAWLPEVFSASGDCVLINPTVFELALPYTAAAVDAVLVMLAALAARQFGAARAQLA